MFKFIFTLLLGAAIAIVVLATRQPDEFSVTRTITVDAPADVVYAQVNDLKKWENWSPWAKIDPAAKVVYEGPAQGVGSKMSWAGNMEVGAGSMTITDSIRPEAIKLALEFEKPMKGSNTSQFNFKQEGKTTIVSWTMSGKNNFVAKVMSVVFNCEKMIGEMFDKGLTSLKGVSES